MRNIISFSVAMPQNNPNIMFRPRIVNALRILSAQRFVVLSAPAGGGKTVAVKQWLMGRSERCVWVHLNEAYNCSSFLKQYLYVALCHLEDAHRVDADRISSMLTNDASLEYLLAKAGQFTHKNQQYILVLDNASSIIQEEAVQALNLLLRALPSNFTVVITSTQTPERLPFLRNLSIGFGALLPRDLAFTLEEANDFFVAQGRVRCKSKLRHAIQVCHGSPTFLQFFLHSMGAYTEDMRGQRPETVLTIYLDKYFWPALSEDERKVLADCSFLSQLPVNLCQRITGIPRTGELLETLFERYPIFEWYADGYYVYHPFLRDYFQGKMRQHHSWEEIRALHNVAGDFHLRSAENPYIPFNATMYYEYGMNPEGYGEALKNVFANFQDISIDATQAFSNALDTIKMPDAYFVENGRICAYLAHSNYFAGNGERFLKYMDLLQPSSEKLLPEGPTVSQPYPLIGQLDFRKDAVAYFENIYPHLCDNQYAELFSFSVEDIPSIFATSMDLPFVHRGIHDYTAFMEGDMEGNFQAMGNVFDKIFPPEVAPLHVMTCKAGLFYEQHNLQAAYELAFAAYDLSGKGALSAKLCFSARLLIAELLYAMNAASDAEIMLNDTRQAIERYNDMYLLANYRAYVYRKRIERGDTHAANEWLSLHALGLTEPPVFYRLYQNFTTLRALICTDSLHTATRLAKRIIRLAQTYRRPLDELEGQLLLSVAYWYDDERKKAQEQMREALLISQRYNYTQIFINHANDVIPILDALAKMQSLRAIDNLDPNYLVSLRILIFNERSGTKSSLMPPGMYPRRIKLSKRQRQVLLMLSQNASYTEIARTLEIKMSTAKSHVLELYRKLGVNSSAEAIALAREHDLLPE